MIDHNRDDASKVNIADLKSAIAPEFATFWHGPLSPLAYTCLASFPHVGARLRVYSYDPEMALPGGLERADARQICPDESLLSRYLAGGKPSLAAFADMFRYKMIRATDCCWVDADIFCLKRPDIAGAPIVFGRQPEAYGQALINNAVLKLPHDHPVLIELIRCAEGAADVDQSWGAIGPFLLTELAEKQGIGALARAPFDFYPVDADQFWKPLLPACCDEVAALAEGSSFLHLWSELYVRSGYDTSLASPAGSFLGALIERVGTRDKFAGVYAEQALESLVARWILDREHLSPMAEPG
jgi:hypothetical protein